MRHLFMCVLGLAALLTPHVDAYSTQTAAKTDTVLSGCLRQGRADTTTANSKGVIYTLVVPGSDKSITSPLPEGSKSAAVPPATYALSFGDSVDLSKHVNHHVSVTGQLLPGTREDTGAKPAKPLPGNAEQMFHVSSLKMISSSCK